MQPIKQELLDLGLEKYGLAVVNVAKNPSLFKIVNAHGQKVIDEYFTIITKAEYALMKIVEEKEAKQEKKEAKEKK